MAERELQVEAIRRGRPVVHTAPWARITVIMLERHAVYLDVISLLIRTRHHKVVSRAEIIRAFVEFMEHSGIDFTRFESADAMVQYLVEYFSHNPKRGRLPFPLELRLFYPERAEVADAGYPTRPIEVAMSP